MSTSSSAASATEPEKHGEAEVQPFPYADAGSTAGGAASTYRLHPTRGSALSEEFSATEKARETGRQQGESRVRAACEQQLAQTRDAVRVALHDFAAERAEYYQRVEAEVVQLALSIARKILHREAQVDPLLLAGIVRVALGKIEAGTGVTVRVHPQCAAEWRGFFAGHMEKHQVPEVIEDPAMAAERCILQSSLGTIELGVEMQLKEIERGLLDLMAQRPQGSP